METRATPDKGQVAMSINEINQPKRTSPNNHGPLREDGGTCAGMEGSSKVDRVTAAQQCEEPNPLNCTLRMYKTGHLTYSRDIYKNQKIKEIARRWWWLEGCLSS